MFRIFWHHPIDCWIEFSNLCLHILLGLNLSFRANCWLLIAINPVDALKLQKVKGMWRFRGMARVVSKISQLEIVRAQNPRCHYSTMVQDRTAYQSKANSMSSDEDRFNSRTMSKYDSGAICSHRIGQNVPKKDKIKFLVSTLLDLKDSKEAVYGTLDAWVAWEQNFPIGPIKIAIQTLEKEQQWHRVVQVIKWMLSKGQGTTRATYGQLIRALDMDHRAEEAHEIWVKKVGHDLHSVPWQLCNLMMSVYYRNNMLDNLVKLFKGMEAFDRKPHEKAVVQRVADTYEILGLLEEKDRVLEKYDNLFTTKQPRRNPFKLYSEKNDFLQVNYQEKKGPATRKNEITGEII